MINNPMILKTYMMTFTTDGDTFRQMKIKDVDYKSAVSQLFRMYVGVNTALLSCKEIGT